jgi:hypothetical protein
MKKHLLYLFLLLTIASFSQSNEEAYKSGEWLKYRMHYGFINAGYATINIDSTSNQNQEAYHVIGKGWTTGVAKFFFKVKDNYQTRFYKKNNKPYHFRRRVDEGGHIISRDVYFDQEKNIALIKDHRKKIEKTVTIENVQDMISSFYYLRNQDLTNIEIADEVKLKMFFDSETFDFRMRFLGTEVIRTKFGKVKCYKFRPIVQSGRVFKAEESLTVWVTADDNKIPVRIKAELAVGSLKADLDEFKGLTNPFNIIFDN